MSAQSEYFDRSDSERSGSTGLAFARRLPQMNDALQSTILGRAASAAGLLDPQPFHPSVLDALSSEIVVLDPRGHVVAANRAWMETAGGTGFSSSPSPLGAHYLDVMTPDWGGGGRAAAWSEGIQSVLSGRVERFETAGQEQQSCGKRRYFLRATRLDSAEGGAVLEKTDITVREEAKEALSGALAQVRELKDRLEAETVGRQVEHHPAHDFAEIVGRTPALTLILEQVRRVAETDAPVLVLGETGTGKDLLARAIHDRSARRTGPLVTVNCAALPATLIESELFGYEKGAFTGALARTPGRFEIADRGTLLLDEIGEMPLELQAKLLRVLQTGEFERLGSSKTVRTNARLVAATNRDLEREVREGRFRGDLFFRLSVFPITLPPLRDRREDIPLLVWHLIARRQGRLGRRIERVPDKLMRAFQNYAWPGNIREVENVIERALILSDGPTLAIDRMFQEARSDSGPGAGTLLEVERQYILDMVERCGGRVGGRGNAAERLGLNRSTLMSRMKKLGISRGRRGATAGGSEVDVSARAASSEAPPSLPGTPSGALPAGDRDR